MIEIIDTELRKTIGMRVSGKLRDEDYKAFVPAIEERMANQGKVRLFVEFHDFHGCYAHAAWDDLKFGLKHNSDFDRIALVGSHRWVKWATQMWKPFTKAKIQFFDTSRADDAWTWLREGTQPLASA